MYLREILEGKKYAELLKIAKEIGLKTGRVKTGNLIQAILDASPLEEPNASPIPTKCKLNSAFEIKSNGGVAAITDDSELELEEPNALLISPKPAKRKRNSTFEIKSDGTAAADTDDASDFQVAENTKKIAVLSEKAKKITSSLIPLTSVVAEISNQQDFVHQICKTARIEGQKGYANLVNSSQASLSPQVSLEGQSELDKKSRLCGSSKLRSNDRLSQNKLSNARGSVENTQQDSNKTPTFTVGRHTTPVDSYAAKSISRFGSEARKLKLPNFSKIHNEAFQKMDTLDEHLVKRQKRAHLLNSTSKSTSKRVPSMPGKPFIPVVSSAKNLNLNFAGLNSPLMSSLSAMNKKVSSIKKTVKISKPNVCVMKDSFTTSETSVKGLKENIFLTNRYNTKKPSGIPVPCFSGTTPKNDKIHPGHKSVATPGSAHRRSMYNPKATQGQILKYKPYTGAVKALPDRATLKSLAEKNPPVKTSVQMKNANKKLLSVVRTNKRFELQMANRLKNKSHLK